MLATNVALTISGTKLDANARAALKNALVLLSGKESKLVKAGEARESFILHPLVTFSA